MPGSPHAGSLRRSRVALIVTDAFVAVTAIGGGIALASGLEGARYPAGWLDGTPFHDYGAPGLLLASVVGGSALVATVAMWRSGRTAGFASIVAGAVLGGWIVGEILVLTNDGELISPMEVLYLAIAVVMVAFGRRMARATQRQEGQTPISESPAPSYPQGEPR